MKLSPLAKQRLAKIGELSDEERGNLKQSQELSSLLFLFHRKAICCFPMDKAKGIFENYLTQLHANL